MRRERIFLPERCIAAIDACFTQSIGFAGETFRRSGTPAAIRSTFGVADKALRSWN